MVISGDQLPEFPKTDKICVHQSRFKRNDKRVLLTDELVIVTFNDTRNGELDTPVSDLEAIGEEDCGMY